MVFFCFRLYHCDVKTLRSIYQCVRTLVRGTTVMTGSEEVLLKKEETCDSRGEEVIY